MRCPPPIEKNAEHFFERSIKIKKNIFEILKNKKMFEKKIHSTHQKNADINQNQSPYYMKKMSLVYIQRAMTKKRKKNGKNE